MTLTKTEILILRQLSSAEDYISSYDISSAAGITRRMVRSLMPEIKDMLEEYDIRLISRANKGYRIENLNSMTRQKLTDLIEESQKSSSPVPEDSISRHNYIMRRLIDSDDYLRIDDIADEMLLSRTVISSLLKEVRGILKKYRLRIEQKPYYGIRIAGEEADKRHALSDFSFTELSDASMFYDFLDTGLSHSESWEYQVMDVFREYQIAFTDIALSDLLIAISIQMKRISQNHVLESYPDIPELISGREYAAARKISSLIRSAGLCDMNEYEVRALAVKIACKCSAVHMELPADFPPEIPEKIHQRILQETGTDYSFSAKKDYLPLAVCHLLRQLKYGEKIRTEMWNTAFTRYPLAYCHARIAAEILQEESGKKPGVSHMVYLTETFQVMMEQLRLPALKALFICGHTDVGEDLLESRVGSRFAGYMKIEKTVQYYQLFEEDLQDYDLLISTISIHRPLDIPYICISQWVSEDDLNAIGSFLHENFALTIVPMCFHPELFRTHVSLGSFKEMIKAFDDSMETVYGEKALKLAKMNEKDYQEEIINGVLIAETVRNYGFRSPWCVLMPEQPFDHQGTAVRMAVLYFGDKTTYKYTDIRKSLAALARQHPEKLTDSDTYMSFLQSLREA
ncbi:MAG: helix-turn-helix domain-containing protein [Solobacterium sp.]|nr:helix-turn-helix domain-containing protein [Solobacterium sp.]